MCVYVNYGREIRVNAHVSGIPGRSHSAKGLKSINTIRNCTES